MISFFPESIQELQPSSSQIAPEKGLLNTHEFVILNSEGVTEGVFNFLTTACASIAAENDIDFTAILLSLDLEKEMNELEKTLMQLRPFFGEKTEKENAASDKLPQTLPKFTTTFKSQEKEYSPAEQLERARTEMMQQRERLITKMQHTDSIKAPFFTVTPKEKESQKIEPKCSEKTEKQQEIHERSILKDSAVTKEKHSEMHRHSEHIYKIERDKKEGKDQEGRKDQQEQEQQKEKQKKKQENHTVKVKKVSASTGSSSANHSHPENEERLDIGDIFVRFIELMARILGQAQADAHELYKRIKERTDGVDVLTALLGKLNNTTMGKIDWSKDEQLKALIDKARALGVEIPPGKYSWSEEEKRALKENIQMRKDTLEKITQLERTDMQRYMQEASQCHQARSNVLKLMKEVNDVIIQNMRGH